MPGGAPPYCAMVHISSWATLEYPFTIEMLGNDHRVEFGLSMGNVLSFCGPQDAEVGMEKDSVSLRGVPSRIPLMYTSLGSSAGRVYTTTGSCDTPAVPKISR